MKSSIRKKTYKAIYRLLDRVSPVEGDCGLLCGSVCCGAGGSMAAEPSSDFEFGMYLMLGEEKLFTRKENWLLWSVEKAEDYGFPDSWHGNVYFIQCRNAPDCPRNLRPLQCRTFPLEPHISAEGVLQLILHYEDLPYACPLITKKIPLDERFVKATYTVWKRLLKDPLIFDLVEMDSADRERYITIVV